MTDEMLWAKRRIAIALGALVLAIAVGAGDGPQWLGTLSAMTFLAFGLVGAIAYAKARKA